MLQRLRFEPAVVRGLVVAVLAFVGVEASEYAVGASVDTAFKVAAFVVPLVQAYWTRRNVTPVAGPAEEPGAVGDAPSA